MALQAKCTRPTLGLFVFIILVRGFHEFFIEYEETINATAGQNIILKCILKSEANLTVSLIEWNKEVNGSMEKFVVTNCKDTSYGDNYNPSMIDIDFDCSSKIRTGNLLIRNVNVSDSGHYTCSFSTFPLGNRKVSMNFNVVNEVDLQEKDVEQPNVLEVMLNSIIKIPCGFHAGANHNFTLEWLTKENGTEERLIFANSFENEINNVTQYRDRTSLGGNYSLLINSSMAVDQRDFICRVKTPYDSGFTSINKVNIFAEPETPQIYGQTEYTDMNNVHLTATCISAKAFPKPNVLWYFDGELLHNGANGSNITSEVSLDVNGLYEVKTKLLLLIENDQWKNIWCEAMFYLPKNRTKTIASRQIQLQKDLGSIEFFPNDYFEVFAGSDFNVLCQVNSSATLQYKWTKDNRTVSNSSKLTVKNATQETAGIYNCSANIPGTNLSRHGGIHVEFQDNYMPPTEVPSETSFPATSSEDLFSTSEPSNYTEATVENQPSPRIGISVSTEASFETASSTISNSTIINSTSITIQPLASSGPSVNINSSINNESTIIDQPNLITQTSTSHELISTTQASTVKLDNEKPETTVSVVVVVVIILVLVSCTILAMYLIKRWQNRKMDGPPSFKPPPPPMKYIAIPVRAPYD